MGNYVGPQVPITNHGLEITLIKQMARDLSNLASHPRCRDTMFPLYGTQEYYAIDTCKSIAEIYNLVYKDRSKK